MTVLTWGEEAKRKWEGGIDRVAVYPPWNPPEVWVGVSSLQEKITGGDFKSLYRDGVLLGLGTTRREFAASIKSIMTPTSVLTCSGRREVRQGCFIETSVKTPFHLTYRTQVRSSTTIGYKIHLIYNVLSFRESAGFQTKTSSVDVSDAEWSLFVIPPDEDLESTGHYVVSTTDISSGQLQNLETKLYGTTLVDGAFPTVAELKTLVGV